MSEINPTQTQYKSLSHSHAQDHPELYKEKADAMDVAFREYNCFGLAESSENYKLPEKDCTAMKVAEHKLWGVLGWD